MILPVSMGIIGMVMGRSQKFFQGQQKYLGDVNGQIEEVYSGHNVVKAFHQEEEAVNEFEITNKKLYNTAWKSQFFSGIMMPIMQFIGNLGYVMAAILGGFMVIRNAIEVGDIQSFFPIHPEFYTADSADRPSDEYAAVCGGPLRSGSFEFLEEEEEDQTVENPVDITKLDGSVEFDHVKFGYKPEQMIIHDFSAKVKDGQKIAIVGPTGAGKTTMVKLLMRFYDVNGGSIRIDGNDVRAFNRGDLRQMFGMVLQDTWLFSGTIMENIRYGKLDATDEEVIAAAKAARVHKFILQQPGGYQMVLNEETSNISQGQKQLLTIARTILADNKILILDEATSSVDTAHGNRDPEGDGPSDERADQLYHRASSVYDPERGSDPGNEGRRHHRTGKSRRTHGCGRLLRGALQQPV